MLIRLMGTWAIVAIAGAAGGLVGEVALLLRRGIVCIPGAAGGSAAR